MDGEDFDKYNAIIDEYYLPNGAIIDYPGRISFYQIDWNKLIRVIAKLKKDGYRDTNSIISAVENNNISIAYKWVIDCIKHYNKKQRETNEDSD